ncbi:MAG TPA: alpha/beta hydrolase [Beijerinckiaceae bacterium]|nr:alpha/beta hydrolase [Beijerinckiaceae bacterium]
MTMTDVSSSAVRQMSARAVDGCEIHFDLHTSAAPDAPRIVLIHALAMAAPQWNELVQELRDTCHLLTVDCRGHGRSEKRPGPYTCDLFADDLACVLDEAGWPSAIVAGCSMGGCVAQAFGLRHPTRTDGLVLIDTTASYGRDAMPKWAERAQRAATQGMAALVDFQLDRWFTEMFRAEQPAAVQRCLDIFLANDPACYGATCDMLAKADLRAQLGTLACPTAVIVGEEDYATPVAMAQDIAARITGAKLTILPQARHFSPVERPRAIAEDVLWVARQASRI